MYVLDISERLSEDHDSTLQSIMYDLIHVMHKYTCTYTCIYIMYVMYDHFDFVF